MIKTIVAKAKNTIPTNGICRLRFALINVSINPQEAARANDFRWCFSRIRLLLLSEFPAILFLSCNKSQHTKAAVQEMIINTRDNSATIPIAASITKTNKILEADQNGDCLFVNTHMIVMTGNTNNINQYPAKIYPAAKHPLEIMRQILRSKECVL